MPRENELTIIAGVSLSLLQDDLPRFLWYCSENPQSFGKYAIKHGTDLDLFKLNRDHLDKYDADDKLTILCEQLNKTPIAHSKLNLVNKFSIWQSTDLKVQALEFNLRSHKVWDKYQQHADIIWSKPSYNSQQWSLRIKCAESNSVEQQFLECYQNGQRSSQAYRSITTDMLKYDVRIVL